MTQEQQGAIHEITEDIRKSLKDPKVIYNLHDRVEKFPALPCDIAAVDDVLCGGLPEGRIIELYGPEASGKTTVLLHFIAAAQKRGELVYFVDAENALDLQYAMRIGVKPKEMMFSQPDYGEQAFDVMSAICDALTNYNEKHQKKMKSLIVLDSVAALVPKQDFDKVEDSGFEAAMTLGSRARMLSQRLPTLCNKAARSGATVVFINQIRDKIGGYGASWDTPGGRALKFFASMRINVVRIGTRKQGETPVGIKTLLKVDKSKLFPIFDKSTEFFIGANGIDIIASLVESCVRAGILRKSGAWLYFEEEKWQGMPKLEEAIRADDGLRDDLFAALAETKK